MNIRAVELTEKELEGITGSGEKGSTVFGGLPKNPPQPATAK